MKGELITSQVLFFTHLVGRMFVFDCVKYIQILRQHSKVLRHIFKIILASVPLRNLLKVAG